MLSDIQNGRKYNYFLNNSTKVFKNIMSKYNKKEKEKLKSKQLLLNFIQSKIKQIENEENENEFIVKEVKRNIQIKKDLLSSFGLKALNHYDEPKNNNIRMKFDKSKFFNPLIDYNKNIPNSSRESNFSQNYKSLKILKFPTISNSVNIKNRIKSINKRKSIKSISKIKINDYSFDKNDISEIETNKSNDTLSISIKKNILLNKKSKDNIHYNKKENNFNSCDTPNNSSEISNKNSFSNLFPTINKSPLITERNYSSFKNKKIQLGLNNRNKIFNFDYLQNIQKIKEKLLLEKEKNEKLLKNNNYGCDLFRLKYNFLKHKYFKNIKETI